MQNQNKFVLQPGDTTNVPNVPSAKNEKVRKNAMPQSSKNQRQPLLSLSTSSNSYSTLLLPTTLQEVHREYNTHPLDKFVNSAQSSCTSSSISMTAMMNKPSASNSTLDQANHHSSWALTHAPRVTNGIGGELPPALTLSRERYKLQSYSPPSSALHTTLRRKSEDKQNRGNITSSARTNRSHLCVDGVDDLRNATVGLLKRHIMHVDAGPLNLPALQNTTETNQSNKTQQKKEKKGQREQVKNNNIMIGCNNDSNNSSNTQKVECTNKSSNTVISNKYNSNQGNASPTNSTNNMENDNVDLLSSDFLNALASQLSNVKHLKQNINDKNNEKNVDDVHQASVTSTSSSAPELNATEERRIDNPLKQNTPLYYNNLSEQQQIQQQEHVEKWENNQNKRINNDKDEAVDDRITPETLLLLLQKGRTKAAALYPRLPASSQALCDFAPTSSSLLRSQDKQIFASTLPSSYNTTSLHQQSNLTNRKERATSHLRVRGQTPQQFLQKPTSKTLLHSTRTRHGLVNYRNNKNINSNNSISSNSIDDKSNDMKEINLPFRQEPSNEEKRNTKLANIRRAELKANIALHEPPSLDLLLNSKQKLEEEEEVVMEQKSIEQRDEEKQSAMAVVDTESDDRTSEEIYITSELQRSSVGLTVTKKAEDTRFVHKLVNIFGKRKNARLRQYQEQQQKQQQQRKKCAKQLLLELEQQEEKESKANGLTKSNQNTLFSTKRVMPLSAITVKHNESKEDGSSSNDVNDRNYKEILHLNVAEEAFDFNTSQAQQTHSDAMRETNKRVMEEIGESVFSVLDSVLAVSREYEQVVRSVNNNVNSCADCNVDASMISCYRQEAIRRLTSFNSTCIPEQYWLTIHNTHLCGHDSKKDGSMVHMVKLNRASENEKAMHSEGNGTKLITNECVDSTINNNNKSEGMKAGSSDHDTFDNVSMYPNDGDRSLYSVHVNENSYSNNKNKDYVNAKHAPNEHSSPSSVIFPGNWPTSRSQVYLLADVIDRMLECNPEWLHTLTNPRFAYCILPHEQEIKLSEEEEQESCEGMKTNVNSTVAVEESTTDNSGKDVYDESNTTAPTIPFCETSRNSNLDNKDNNNLAMVAAESNILLDPEVQHASHEAFEQYTWASSAVVQIINTGLVELVRQVSCECLERGSLLDCLRQLLVDVVESHIRVLHYAKSRAFNEAQWRLQESEQKREMEKQMHEACERAHALEMENASLLKSQEQLKLKASRLDDLVERVHAKREKFDIHTEDEHAALLKMIEDDLTSSAGAALSKLYDLQFDLEKESNNNADDANSTKTTTLATKERKEAPSASEARKKLEEQQHANEQLYHNSYQLLNTLTDAVEAVNAACAPLYDEVILKEVSSMANVAAAKWATIARAIGSFEREQTHRQRVFQIFSEWCDRFRHRNHQHEHRASQSVSVNVNNASDHSHSSLIDSHYYNNNNNNNNNNENRDENEDMPNEQMRYLTTSDLAKMHVSDVSADEVNAMFARDFDFNAYLDTEWRHSSSSSLSSNCTLTTADVNCMIHDTQVILHEIVLRLNAIAHSSIVWKGSQPPLQAPSHPLDPCVLCGRCDVVLEEKQKRQGALRAIASEVQSQIEELTNKCQHAEAERQSSRAQLKTLREELEHAKSEITLLKQELNTLQTSNGMKQISSTINSPSSLSPSSLEMVNASNMAPTSVFTIGRKNRLTRKTNTSLSSSSVHSVKSNSPRQPQQPLQETQSRRRHNNYYYRQQQQQQQQQLQSQRRDSNTLVSSSSTLSTLSPSPPPLASSPSINSSVENTVIMTDTLVFGTNTSTDISNNNNSNVIAMTNDPHYLSDAPPSLEHTMTDVNTPHVGDNNSVKESEQKR